MTNWKGKLASRKFWGMVAGFIGSILVAFNVGDNEISQVAAIVSGFGAIAVYILTEGANDRASINAEGNTKEGDA